MPRINLAEYFPQSMAQRTPTVSMHALDGEFEAGRNVAHAAAGLAGTVADIDMKIRDARESAERRQAEVELNAAANDFVGELTEKKDEDFDTWEARWDKRMGDTLKKLQPKTLSARGREAWGRMVEQFKVQSAVEMRNTRRVREAKVTGEKWNSIIKADIESGDVNALTQDIANAEAVNALSKSEAENMRRNVIPEVEKKKFNSALKFAVDNGDEAEAMQVIDEMRSRKMISSDEAKFAKAEAGGKIDRLSFIEAMGADGSGAFDVKQRLAKGEGRFNAEERAQLIARADTQNLRYGATVLDGFNAEYAQTGEWPTPEVVHEEVKKGRFSKETGAKMRVEYERKARSDPNDQYNRFLYFQAVLNDYKPYVDGQPNVKGLVAVREAMTGLKGAPSDRGGLYYKAGQMISEKEDLASSFNRNPAWGEARQRLLNMLNHGGFGPVGMQRVADIDPITNKQRTVPKMVRAWDIEKGQYSFIPSKDKDGNSATELAWQTEEGPDGRLTWKLAFNPDAERVAAEAYLEALNATEKYFQEHPEATAADWHRQFQADIKKADRAEADQIKARAAVEKAAVETASRNLGRVRIENNIFGGARIINY
jgi:hypothetical protein